MALIVQKYGGTSVGSAERIGAVADRVARFKSEGHAVVVVVSAMSGETNRLLGLAKEIQSSPAPRELDALLSTGEKVTTALLSMALGERSVRAKSYSGNQVGILTDSAHNKARIQDIQLDTLKKELDSGGVPVVAGFQGVDVEGNVTTLGRGGSDTTAVALAAALKPRSARFTLMSMASTPPIPEWWTVPSASIVLPLKKCSKCRAWAQRCFNFARWSLPANIKFRCGC